MSKTAFQKRHDELRRRIRGMLLDGKIPKEIAAAVGETPTNVQAIAHGELGFRCVRLSPEEFAELVMKRRLSRRSALARKNSTAAVAAFSPWSRVT